MEPKIGLTLSFFLFGLLIMGISIPLILQKIPPNLFYGWKTRKSLSNKQIWYKVNKYSGKDLFIVGLVVCAVAFVLLVFRTKLSEAVIVWIGLASIIIPIAVAVFRGLCYESKL